MEKYNHFILVGDQEACLIAGGRSDDEIARLMKTLGRATGIVAKAIWKAIQAIVDGGAYLPPYHM